MSENTDIEGRLDLRLLPATAALFRPYGHLVSAGAADPVHVNAGTALRYDIARIDADTRPGSRLVASVFETAPQALPLVVRLMERHAFSQQAIVAMHSEDFILAVALDDGHGRPDLASLRAFHFSGGGGVVYRRGVWHTPIIGLGGAGRFFVQSWQAGTTEDCEEQIVGPFVIRAGG
ncbi:ureidoglycolate lyase [Ancylobacter rudongensis]|uniref:Ureidoglycolate lyase n=1 Tax=Ancylobacter rudongensis TaxID=177413 RepID=A0A1G4TJB3_9HYPH|nr:ureidoglycolate lyase [Ancylobacter rudongensis]SCW81510.1 ureidoglycolate lyase [Ancylobacter rudongensis]